MNNETLEKPPAKRVTMKDVAKAAHVATSTVSRALNRPGRTNPLTAEHVFRVAREMGYISEDDARCHRSAPLTKRFGVVIDMGNTALISALKASATESGYQLIFLDANSPLGELGTSCQTFLKHVDGFLIDSEKTKVELNAFVEHHPLVWLNRETSKYDVVIPDVKQSISEIITFLRSQPDSRFTVMHAEGQSWVTDECMDTVSKLSKKYKLDMQVINGVTNSVNSGYKVLRHWERRALSNVLVFGNLAAVGFIRALREKDPSALQSVAILGVGEPQNGLLALPTLSTLEIPQETIARVAVKRLLEKIHDPNPGAKHAIQKIPMRLIRRESTRIWRQH
ncbi:transcriptional regulator, LacI family [Mobiluncus mulieris 28-1]|nr:LacI family DNA-binding transcriptional regulator [Mobiluncus mulieris]EEZ91148.1 transcriptional regulator, LacI family [Mobiluncus mulieris 28-1]EFN93273.1 transcriptional regulator, LacI family [Mobiluncus mulieris FB024-16]MBB5846056.1 LacI family transcriptional regulator [Mobiluncus mulieris]SPX75856.1 Glucose-resistance amylase regulator [Mobiluncus mulieris]STO17459.1 Glucose-resistance amylase regulator [Mobiluncus mulieris]